MAPSNNLSPRPLTPPPSEARRGTPPHLTVIKGSKEDPNRKGGLNEEQSLSPLEQVAKRLEEFKVNPSLNIEEVRTRYEKISSLICTMIENKIEGIKTTDDLNGAKQDIEMIKPYISPMMHDIYEVHLFKKHEQFEQVKENKNQKNEAKENIKVNEGPVLINHIEKGISDANDTRILSDLYLNYKKLFGQKVKNIVEGPNLTHQFNEKAQSLIINRIAGLNLKIQRGEQPSDEDIEALKKEAELVSNFGPETKEAINGSLRRFLSHLKNKNINIGGREPTTTSGKMVAIKNEYENASSDFSKEKAKDYATTVLNKETTDINEKLKNNTSITEDTVNDVVEGIVEAANGGLIRLIHAKKMWNKIVEGIDMKEDTNAVKLLEKRGREWKKSIGSLPSS